MKSMLRLGNRIAVAALVASTAYAGIGVAASATRGSKQKLSGQTPPETQIVKAKVRRARGFARFRFTSSEPGSAFRCRLGRQRFRACDSPKTYRHLKDGRHIFRVKAIGPEGVGDPTPAIRRIRTRRPPFPPIEDVEPAHMLSGEDCEFVSPEVFSPVRNGWAVANRNRSTIVCAGGAGSGASTTGRFLILRTNDRWGTQQLSKVDVPNSGAVKITRAPLGRDVVTSAQRHGNLAFEGTTGVTGTLHLKDDSVSVDPMVP
jgi:hypothetical protein